MEVQEEHPAGCEKFGEVNFGRIRNASIGAKAGVKGPAGEDIVRPSPSLLRRRN